MTNRSGFCGWLSRTIVSSSRMCTRLNSKKDFSTVNKKEYSLLELISVYINLPITRVCKEGNAHK